jgi:hypothetical protein
VWWEAWQVVGCECKHRESSAHSDFFDIAVSRASFFENLLSARLHTVIGFRKYNPTRKRIQKKHKSLQSEM